jgi:recombination protein RecA
MSQALRILNPAVSRTSTCIIFINQLRQKVGVMFGSPETTSGGMALKYYCSVRLDIRKITSIKDGEETVGARVRVKVVKNKVAPPFRVAELDLMHANGFSWEGDLIDLAEEDKLIQKSGAWFTVGTERMQGRESCKQFLREHPEVVEDLRQKILEKRGLLRQDQMTESDGVGMAEPTEPAAAAEPKGRKGKPAKAAEPAATEDEFAG